MDTQTLLIIVGVFSGLLLVGFLLYRGSAEGEISIWDKLKFQFKGKEKSAPKETNQVRISIGDQAQIEAREIIGRDKHETHIHQETSPKPTPKLKLYLRDREGELRKELGVPQDFQQHPLKNINGFMFQIALKNDGKGTSAKGVEIDLYLSWEGVPPSKAIRFNRLTNPQGWFFHKSKITEKEAAYFSFADSNLMSSFNQYPKYWGYFRGEASERLSGNIRIDYSITSHDPYTENKGKLIVRLED